MHDYTTKFLRLTEHNELQEPKAQEVARYLDGLKSTFRNRTRVQSLYIVPEAQNMALNAE